MSVPNTAEKWTSAVNQLTIGATAQEGGTRKSRVKIGGGDRIAISVL